jgi:hypothetical protein
MKVTDPKSLLGKVEKRHYNSIRTFPIERSRLQLPIFSEPVPVEQASTTESINLLENQNLPKSIEGRIQRFGDNVDTDQVCLFKYKSNYRLFPPTAALKTILVLTLSTTSNRGFATLSKAGRISLSLVRPLVADLLEKQRHGVCLELA